MKNYLILLAAMMLFCLNACNSSDERSYQSLVSEKITNENLNRLASKASQSEMSNSDKNLFAAGLMRYANNPDSLIGKTINDVIAKQQEYESEIAQRNVDEAAARLALFMNHSFKYLGVKYDDTNPAQKKNKLVFQVTNKSNKDIAHIFGTLTFYALDGTMIKMYDLGTGGGIISHNGKAIIFEQSFLHDDSFRDSLVRYSKELRAVWTPSIIQFVDSSKLQDIANNRQ